MSFIKFCSVYGYNVRCDMAKESYNDFKRFFSLQSDEKVTNELLNFLGLNTYLGFDL